MIELDRSEAINDITIGYGVRITVRLNRDEFFAMRFELSG